jgi:tetratricopeptide (TPR) repeat protein
MRYIANKTILCILIVALPMCSYAQAEDDPMSKGIEAFQRKQYDLAIALFGEAIRINPNEAAAYNNRGRVHCSMKNFKQAIKDFSEAIRINPQACLYYCNRGGAYCITKNYDMAISDLTIASDINPNNEDVFLNLGSVYRVKKEYDRAIDCYSKAIKIKPMYALAFSGRGFIYAFQKKYDQAVKDFAETITLDPTNSKGYIYLSHLLAVCPNGEVRDGKKALKYANKACELDAWGNPYSFAVLGSAYAEVGDFPAAIKWTKKALEYQLSKQTLDKCNSRIILFRQGKPSYEDFSVDE